MQANVSDKMIRQARDKRKRLAKSIRLATKRIKDFGKALDDVNRTIISEAKEKNGS